MDASNNTETMDSAMDDEEYNPEASWIVRDDSHIRCTHYGDSSRQHDASSKHAAVSWVIADRRRSNWEPVFRPPPPQFVLKKAAEK
jgi:hypothetical protein